MFRYHKRTQKPSKPEYSSVALLACSIKREQWFPQVDKYGRAYTFPLGKSASAAKKARTYLDGREWCEHLNLHFRQGPVVITGPPRDRASLYKKDNKQADITNLFPTATLPEAPPPDWWQDDVALAAREFEVPNGTRILYLWPDLFDRDILIDKKEFQRHYLDDKKKKKIGVLTRCPGCNSNEHVEANGFSCKKGKIRRVLDTSGTFFITHA